MAMMVDTAGNGGDFTALQPPELWSCGECGREFVDEASLRLHAGLHSAEDSFPEAEVILRRELLYKEVRRQEDQASGRQPLPTALPRKPRRIYRPNSKRVGLTKIRLEDCLRCDACSCIYIDERDYYKHMRNFHQKYNTVIPRSRRKSPLRHKCVTMNCSEVFVQDQPQEKRVDFPIDTKKEEEKLSEPFQLSGSFFKEKIKNRWNKVSERLSSQVKIKQEPLDDMDYYLSQVEVKIKTEPPEI